MLYFYSLPRQKNLQNDHGLAKTQNFTNLLYLQLLSWIFDFCISKKERRNKFLMLVKSNNTLSVSRRQVVHFWGLRTSSIFLSQYFEISNFLTCLFKNILLLAILISYIS